MKAVILAGGLGTRLSEETHLRPKPMVEIGGKPILWHILKLYSHYGINDFVICCGYKGYVIKEYFSNYFLHLNDVTISLDSNTIDVHCQKSEPWNITLVDTGDATMTGGRLKRVSEYLDGSSFCFTYGDGLSNVNIQQLVRVHKNSGLLATVTAVQPPGRYGALNFDSQDPSLVANFQEKPLGDGNWINGGFFVLEPEAIQYIEGDSSSWENEPLKRLAAEKKLGAFKHEGFWMPMDTLRDKNELETLWSNNRAPWRVWS